MEIELPAIPLGVVTLLNVFAPAAIALVNHPAWSPGWKRLMSYVVSAVLTVVSMWFYYILTGDAVPNWPVLILLGIAVSQAAFTTVRGKATRLEARHGVK